MQKEISEVVELCGLHTFFFFFAVFEMNIVKRGITILCHLRDTLVSLSSKLPIFQVNELSMALRHYLGKYEWAVRLKKR